TLPLLRAGIRRMYRITPESIAEARRRTEAALDRLEAETAGDPGRFLVGDRLGLADIAAAALLGPVVVPPGSPWDGTLALPAIVAELRDSVRARPAGRWLLRRWQERVRL